MDRAVGNQGGSSYDPSRLRRYHPDAEHVVYMLTFADGRRYIGKTTDVGRRLAQLRTRGNTRLKVMLRDHGEPDVTILHRRCHPAPYVARAQVFVLEAWEIAQRDPELNVTRGAEARTPEDVRAWKKMPAWPAFSADEKALEAWKWFVGGEDART